MRLNQQKLNINLHEGGFITRLLCWTVLALASKLASECVQYTGEMMRE